MLSLSAFLALARRVPLSVYAALTFVVVVWGAAWAFERHGEHVGVAKVHRAAVRDSVVTQRAVVVAATVRSDTAVVRAVRKKDRSDRARAELARVRSAAAPALDVAPPVVQQLVAAQDTVIVRDSVTIVGAFAAIDSLKAERPARDSLAALQARVTEPEPEPSHAVRDVGVIAVVVAAIVELLHHFLR